MQSLVQQHAVIVAAQDDPVGPRTAFVIEPPRNFALVLEVKVVDDGSSGPATPAAWPDPPHTGHGAFPSICRTIPSPTQLGHGVTPVAASAAARAAAMRLSIGSACRA